MTKTKMSLGWWQLETLLVTMAGYALYYLVRKNLSFAMPVLTDEFGISKVELGAFLTAHGLVYGFARFTNGILTDLFSARKVMALGLFVCAAVNLAFGLSDFIAGWFSSAGTKESFTVALVWTMGVIWVINGYFQGMGVGPCVKTLPRWFPPHRLATMQSIWNASHSIGAGCGIALLGWWLIPAFHTSGAHDGAWRLCFLVPAGIAFAGAFGILLSMRDSPEQVGLPPVTQSAAVSPEKGSGHGYGYVIVRYVLLNPCIWILAVSNFCVNTVRFAFLDWGPTLLHESKGYSLVEAATFLFAFEIVGGNLGMVVAGWVSDHVFGSRTHRTCVFCFAGVALAVAGFWLLPASASFWAQLVLFTLIGFFVYGPQALLGISSTQQATPRAAAAAGGVLGILGYLSTSVSGVGFGWMAQRAGGWDGVYMTILALALAGGLVVALMWRAPAERQD